LCVALDAESSYRYVGGGPVLALEMSGPTMESCLACAIEGVSAAFAEVHPSITGRRVEIGVDAASPAAMLRDVLEITASLRANGDVPVTVERAELIDGRLVVALEVVPAGAARALVDWRSTIDWQHLALERRDGHWVGRVVADM